MEDYQEPNQNQTTPSRSRRRQDKPIETKQPKPPTQAVRIRPILAGLLLLMILFLGAVFGSSMMSKWQAGQNNTPMIGADGTTDENLANISILLVGCDQRDNEVARADTLMLVILRPDDKEVSLLSIPRDVLVKIPGHETTRINHSFAYGGMDLLKETVQNLLGNEIDYTMQVNFAAFKDIVDALGGVTIDVERRMYKPLENIDLQPGVQHLDGYDALAYVRYRESVHADLGRIERQQKFLAALVDSLKNMNLKEALSVAGAVMDNLVTDMSVAEMTRYGSKFVGMSAGDIETHSLRGEDASYNQMDVLKVTQEEIDTVMHLMQYGVPEETDVPNEEGTDIPD